MKPNEREPGSSSAMLLFFSEVTLISTSFPSSRAMAPQQPLLLTPVLLRLWKGLNPDVSAFLGSLLSSFSEFKCLSLVSGLSWPWAKHLWTGKHHFPPCSGLREPKGIQVVYESLPSIKGCSLQRREALGLPCPPAVCLKLWLREHSRFIL